MRYGIFSDVHANLCALEAVIEAYKKENIDSYACAGDIVGYGANPNECVAQILSLGAACVAGNHDWASVGLFSLSWFNEEAASAVRWTEKHLSEAARSYLACLKLVYKNNNFTIVHSSLVNPQNFEYMVNDSSAWETFELMETGICFTGHSHIPSVLKIDKNNNIYYQKFLSGTIDIEAGSKYIINAGAVGQPRDGDRRACFCVYDTVLNKVEIKRADYDFALARERIIEAGLPARFGDRLLTGK